MHTLSPFLLGSIVTVFIVYTCFGIPNNNTVKSGAVKDSSNMVIPFADSSGKMDNNHEIGVITGILLISS